MTDAMMASERAEIAAKHLIGNLWYDLKSVPLIAGRLNPIVMGKAVNGPATLAYAEMCKLLRSGNGDRLNAGQLEANLKDVNFDFAWLHQAQKDIANDTIADLYQYAAEVQNASDLLDVKAQCVSALRKTNEPTAKADKIKADLMVGMTAMTMGTATGPSHISEVSLAVREEFRRLREDDMEWGASTGLQSLYRVFRLVDGNYITIGARPSQGKSSLMAWIAYQRALELKRSGEEGQVLIFSMDDTSQKIVRALACSVAQVDNTKIRQRQGTDDDWTRLADAQTLIEGLPIYIDGNTQLTVEDIHYRTAMQNTQSKVRLVLVDYIERVKAPGYKDNDLSRLRMVAAGCKDIGHIFDCPIIMLSQLTKSVEDRADKWPTSSDLKYAGEDESDVILLLNRPEHYIAKGEHIDCDDGDKSGIVMINVAKNKEGRVGLVRLAFKKEYTRFADLMR